MLSMGYLAACSSLTPGGNTDVAGTAGARSPGGAGGLNESGGAGALAGSEKGGGRAGGAAGESGRDGMGGAGGVAGESGRDGMGGDGGAAGDGGGGRDDCFDQPQVGLCPMSYSGNNTCVYETSVCVCEPVDPGGYLDTAWVCAPLGCPVNKPTHEPCTTLEPKVWNTRCAYGATVCSCDALFGQISSWDCFEPVECPAVAPMEGEACTPIDDEFLHNDCWYGSRRCHCFEQLQDGFSGWSCYEAG
jgi:hypothetical protein